MTLNEVADQVGLTRRMIQEYEKSGLVMKPETRNKYGHLLYDEKTIDRLWQIRFYREVGYNGSQIRSAISEHVHNDDERLESLIKSMTKEKQRLETMINLATMMKEGGISFCSLRHGIIEESGIKSGEVFAILGMSYKYMEFLNCDERIVDVLSDDEWDEVFARIRRIVLGCQRKVPYEDKRVQKLVAGIHGVCKRAVSESHLLFKEMVTYINPENRCERESFEGMSDDTIEYVHQAFQYYCDVIGKSRVDMECIEAFDNLERLAYARYSADSKEIQGEVKKIHNFYRGMKFFAEDTQLEMLERMGKLYGSQTYRDEFDGGREKGVAWFMSKAIEIYCSNFRKAGTSGGITSQEGG